MYHVNVVKALRSFKKPVETTKSTDESTQPGSLNFAQNENQKASYHTVCFNFHTLNRLLFCFSRDSFILSISCDLWRFSFIFLTFTHRGPTKQHFSNITSCSLHITLHIFFFMTAFNFKYDLEFVGNLLQMRFNVVPTTTSKTPPRHHPHLCAQHKKFHHRFHFQSKIHHILQLVVDAFCHVWVVVWCAACACF
jgi:hypothetical protein